MQCLYLVFVGCFILAADAHSGSNNDAEFIAGVSSKLFGKCFGKYNCQAERDALEKAIGTEEICKKAEQYTLCYTSEKACNTSAGFNNLTKLGDDLKNRFCGNTKPSPETTTGSRPTIPNATPAPTTTGSSTTTASTTPAPTTTGSSTTTASTTLALTTTDASTTTTTPSADSTTGKARRKRQTDGAINEAVQRLLNQNMDCAIEMCTDKQTKMFSPKPQTINCSLLEEYGSCLVQSCPLMSKDVQTTKDQCGAASRILLSSTVLLVGILLRILA